MPYKRRFLNERQLQSREKIFQRRERRAKAYLAQAAQFLTIDDFVKTCLFHSATQARISQLLSETCDDMQRNASKWLSDTPCEVTFAGGDPSRIVGHPQFTYLTSHVRPNGDVMHRGYFQQEMTAHGPAVRLYMTICSAHTVMRIQTANGYVEETAWKEIQQDSAGNIKIYPAGTILWLNAGEPLRALKWFTKYKKENVGLVPLIRSFLVPTHVFLTLSRAAISEAEHTTAQNPMAINVDQSGAANQFGIVGAGIEFLKQHAIRGSLITYTEKPEVLQPGVNGVVYTIASLYHALGITAELWEAVWLEETKTPNKYMIRRNNHSKFADEMMGIYALWIGKVDEYCSRSEQTTLVRNGDTTNLPTHLRNWLLNTLEEKYGRIVPSPFREQILTGRTPAEIADTLRKHPEYIYPNFNNSQ